MQFSLPLLFIVWGMKNCAFMLGSGPFMPVNVAKDWSKFKDISSTKAIFGSIFSDGFWKTEKNNFIQLCYGPVLF